MEVVEETVKALYSMGKHFIKVAWNFTAAIGKKHYLENGLQIAEVYHHNKYMN